MITTKMRILLLGKEDFCCCSGGGRCDVERRESVDEEKD